MVILFSPDLFCVPTVVRPAQVDIQQMMLVAFEAEKKGRLPEAITAYENVISHFQGFAPAYFKLAAIYFHLGMPSKAEGYYLDAVDKGVDDPDVYLNLGYIKESRGDLNQSLEYYMKGELAASKNPILYFNMGNVQARLGKQDKAVDAFKHAVALNAQYKDAFVNLAILLADKGEYQDAQYYLEKAEKLGYDAPAEFKQGLAARLAGAK
ncbi:MAG: tetratricopeptide repeat protein [Candidatus Omnitrophota bacterium]